MSTPVREPHMFFDPFAERVCVGCGCTDADACVDRQTGEPCHWVEGCEEDICSACAAIALMILERLGRDVNHEPR